MTNPADSANSSGPLPAPSSRAAFVSWVVFLAFLIPLFAVLAHHPQWFLLVEKEQPSRGLIRARELADQGRYGDALSVLDRTLKFYKEQLEKTDSPRHRMTVASIHHSKGLILLNRDAPGDRSLARENFRLGVEVDPNVRRGEGKFLLAELIEDDDPAEAVRLYAGVVDAVSSGLAFRARRRNARLLTELERWEEARRAYEDAVRYQPSEPDNEMAAGFTAVAGRVGYATGSPLGRAYWAQGRRDRARKAFAASRDDPVSDFYLSKKLGVTEADLETVEFAPELAFVASAAVDSVSFTWPAGCIIEFVATEEAEGKPLSLRLQPDYLPPQRIELPIFLNGADAGSVAVTSGGVSDYPCNGELRPGRNVVEIRCANRWFAPDRRPVITVLDLKPSDDFQ